MKDFNHHSYSKRLWLSFILENKLVYSVGILFVLVTNISQVLVTRNLGWILDFFSKESIPAFFSRWNQNQIFYILLGILIATRVFLFLGRVGWRRTLARMTHKSSAMLRTKLWDNVRFLKRSDLDSKFSKGLLMNNTTSDVNSARFIFGFTLVALTDFFFLGILALGTMLSIHVQMTLWSLAVLLVLPFIIKKLSSLEMDRYRVAQEFLSDFNDLASQVVSTIRLQRLTQTGKYWEKKLLENAEDYRKRRLHAVFTSLNYIPTTGLASIVSYIVLFGIGIRYVFSGEMSIGDFVAMQGMIFLLQDPLFELGFIISEFKKSFTSMSRLSEVYNEEKDLSLTSKGVELNPTENILEVKNLCFSHKNTNNSLIKDFNLILKKGERLGISGPIGTGKSTLVNILSGIERKIEGNLTFLGKEFDEYSHENLRSYIGFVPQKAFLFASTIRENISIDKDLSDEQVWSYLDLAGLKEDVLKFKEQLDTPLGEWGINLSGGQKQRMTLARALARKPKLLFLDDCLSAVDTVTEEKILKNLDRELSDVTLVWVAHRKSTLKYCQQHMELS